MRLKTAVLVTGGSGGEMQRTFGIEEEFMLLNPWTLRPVEAGAAAIGALDRHGLEGALSGEFLPSQIEFATAVCTTPEQALHQLQSFRTALATWGDGAGLLAAPVGTPPRRPLTVSQPIGARYRRIADDVGLLSQEHLVNGLHVHVGVQADELRVRAVNGLRDWLPLLVAIAGNSPFWDGRFTGFHSWRAIHTRRWTTNGIPPLYADFDDHERTREQMTGIGATRRYSEASWGARLSDDYPTVEVRVCDVQLRAQDAVGLAELIRAVVDRTLGGAPIPPTAHHLLDAELWHAARFGLSRGIHDPLRGGHRSAWDVIAQLPAHLQLGHASTALLCSLPAVGSGADRQLRTRGARPNLARLLRSSLAPIRAAQTASA